MNTYLVLKALHIISFTAWMAGMFYLPRLYVYHTQAIKGGESDLMLQTMERKLLRIIINPSMILTLVFGVALMAQLPDIMKSGWMHAKIMLVLGMVVFHAFLARTRRHFVEGGPVRSERFYRVLNEVPTLLLIGIVFLVVLKPF